jgi:thioredoxin-related protein
MMTTLRSYALGAVLAIGASPLLAENKPVLPAKIELAALEGDAKLSKADITGKKVLIQFWASWCVGCGQVMQDLLPYEPDGKKAMYLSVSVDESKDQARAYFKHQNDTVKGMQKKSWIDPDTTLATALNIKSLPALVLIDSNGNVIENLYGHPTPNQMKMIAEFLK